MTDVDTMRTILRFARDGDHGSRLAVLERADRLIALLDELERARATLSRLEEHVDELAERRGGAA